jgi:hypothetical protein
VLRALERHFDIAAKAINPGGKSRRKSFEISIAAPGKETKMIWSGIKLGPPRNLKFPDDEHILKLAVEAMKGL